MAMSHQGFWLNKITGASRGILPKKAKELIVKQICLNCGATIKEEWRNCHKQCPYCGCHTLIKKYIVKSVERACGNHESRALKRIAINEGGRS